MTSSRRHFVKIKSLSYLDNESSKINHIWYTSTSGQSSTKNVNKICARTSTRTYARIKILKCSNSFQIFFAHVSGHCKHFQDFAREHFFARVSARNCAYWHFTTWKRQISLSYQPHFSKHFDTLFTFFWPVITQWASVKVYSTRGSALSLSTLHVQKQAYTKFILTLQNG